MTEGSLRHSLSHLFLRLVAIVNLVALGLEDRKKGAGCILASSRMQNGNSGKDSGGR